MHSSATSNYMAKNHLLAVTTVSANTPLPSSDNLDHHRTFGETTTPVKFAGTKFHTTSPSPKNLPIPVFQSQKESPPSSLTAASISSSKLSTFLSSRSSFPVKQRRSSLSTSPIDKKSTVKKAQAPTEDGLLTKKKKKKSPAPTPTPTPTPTTSNHGTFTKPITILKPNRNQPFSNAELDISKNFEASLGKSFSALEGKSSPVSSLDILSSSLKQMLNVASTKSN